jgi:hypothetical protein
MHRVTDTAKLQMAKAALDRLPWSIGWLGGITDLFTEDAVFAGITPAGLTFDGRSYNSTGHVVYPIGHDYCSTIVLPADDPVGVADLVHEFAHVLDFWWGFRLWVPQTTEYSTSNGQEAFAEWVCAWTCDEYRAMREIVERDEHSRALWSALSHGRWYELDNFA